MWETRPLRQSWNATSSAKRLKVHILHVILNDHKTRTWLLDISILTSSPLNLLNPLIVKIDDLERGHGKTKNHHAGNSSSPPIMEHHVKCQTLVS
jgi:hypothetical protein